MIFTFKDTKKLAASTLQHAIQNSIKEPSLVLVKDQGVYLMPSLELPDGATSNSAGLTSYADGHDPNKDAFDDWWIGGDDYSEKIPVRRYQLAWLEAGCHIQIKVTSSEIEVTVG